MAMYKAKAAGRNTLRFFDQDMQDAVRVRAALKEDLNRALANNEFVLHYQPMMDASKQVLGYEAYVRWNHPQRGLLNPPDFMGISRSNPLIMPINDWALRAACEQLGLWAKQPATQGLNLSVNISACSLEQADFADHVAQVLRETDANPYRLILEFKEIQPGQADQLMGKMRALRALGVRFAMDDFGAGYTPLNLLKQLPLSQVKISRSFVQNVNRNPDDASMVRTILSLAQNMDLMAWTEGVETFDQYDKLSSYGCELFQGFLFGRPEPLSHWGLAAANATTTSAVA
jgi:EAL domain-containing protein (putative c-di-GMP-specific phosphodiesterase class I)